MIIVLTAMKSRSYTNVVTVSREKESMFIASICENDLSAQQQWYIIAKIVVLRGRVSVFHMRDIASENLLNEKSIRLVPKIVFILTWTFEAFCIEHVHEIRKTLNAEVDESKFIQGWKNLRCVP